MLTICHITNRINPCHDWFVDSLWRECGGIQDFQLIFLDARLWYENDRKEKLEQIIRGRFVYEHVPPKPTVWQGPNRLTKSDWFAASNVRNTGFALARGNAVAFVDDLSVLLPGWLVNVRHAADNGYLMGGAYKKVWKLVVEDGVPVSFEETPDGVDSRWNIGSDSGIVPIDAGAIYGCSICVPLEAALRCNGFDEIYDGEGAEDCDFGLRMGRSGVRTYYNRNARTFESVEMHAQEPVMKRVIKHANNSDSSIVLLNRVTNENRITTLSDHYSLRALRDTVLSGGSFPVPLNPMHHWFDGQPLSEM